MKPNFKDGYPISKELFATEMGKRKITINQPWAGNIRPK